MDSSTMQKELGQSIRNIRMQKKMNLKEFSEKTGLSISFLSMVERGLTSVAIVSLKKIADALEHDISDFFQKSEQKQGNGTHCIRRSYHQQISYQHGKYIYFALGDGRANKIIDPMVVLLLPGQERDEVVHFRHMGEEFVYVLEGVLSFFLDGVVHELAPGDSFVGPCDVPHNFVNLTNNVVRVLFVLTPPLFSSDQNLMDRQGSLEGQPITFRDRV